MFLIKKFMVVIVLMMKIILMRIVGMCCLKFWKFWLNIIMVLSVKIVSMVIKWVIGFVRKLMILFKGFVLKILFVLFVDFVSVSLGMVMSVVVDRIRKVVVWVLVMVVIMNLVFFRIGCCDFVV